MNLTALIKKYAGSFGAHSAGAGRLDPVRDWLALVSVTLILILGSVAWSAWFFLSAIAERPIALPPAASTASTTDMTAKAKEAFDTRAGIEGRYRADYRFNDPAK